MKILKSFIIIMLNISTRDFEEDAGFRSGTLIGNHPTSLTRDPPPGFIVVNGH